MARLFREILYATGHMVEFILSMDSEIAEKFYREDMEKPSGEEIKYLLEKASYKDIKRKAIKGYPFTYRKFLKDCYVNCYGIMKDPVTLCNGDNPLKASLEKNSYNDHEHKSPFIM